MCSSAPVMRAMFAAPAVRVLRECTTPFGRPVVPEVNSTTAGRVAVGLRSIVTQRRPATRPRHPRASSTVAAPSLADEPRTLGPRHHQRDRRAERVERSRRSAVPHRRSSTAVSGTGAERHGDRRSHRRRRSRRRAPSARAGRAPVASRTAVHEVTARRRAPVGPRPLVVDERDAIRASAAPASTPSAQHARVPPPAGPIARRVSSGTGRVMRRSATASRPRSPRSCRPMIPRRISEAPPEIVRAR